MDEDRSLIDTLVGINPGILAHLFIVITQHEGIETGTGITVQVHFHITITEDHIITEALEVGSIDICFFCLTVGQSAF